MVTFDSINWAVIAPLLLIQVLLCIFALIDLAKQARTRASKLLWLFIILFVNIIGPVLYFIFGKKE